MRSPTSTIHRAPGPAQVLEPFLGRVEVGERACSRAGSASSWRCSTRARRGPSRRSPLHVAGRPGRRHSPSPASTTSSPSWLISSGKRLRSFSSRSLRASASQAQLRSTPRPSGSSMLGRVEVAPVEVDDAVPLPGRGRSSSGRTAPWGRARRPGAGTSTSGALSSAEASRHEDQAVGEREEGERGRRVAGAEPAHAGRVDDDEALLQERARHGDLDPLDALLVARVAGLGDPARAARRSAIGSAAGPSPSSRRARRRAGCLAVAHERDGRRGEVVVDRAHGWPRSPLTSELLPCLNSPTTHTIVAGRCRRAAAAVTRPARSGRSSWFRSRTSSTEPWRTASAGDGAVGAVVLIVATILSRGRRTCRRPSSRPGRRRPSRSRTASARAARRPSAPAPARRRPPGPVPRPPARRTS